jgi:hypothetical protein
MSSPEPKMTQGTLTAPRLEISFDRVSGWMMLYAVIARKAYTNIRSAVGASSRRTSAKGLSSRCSRDMDASC